MAAVPARKQDIAAADIDRRGTVPVAEGTGHLDTAAVVDTAAAEGIAIDSDTVAAEEDTGRSDSDSAVAGTAPADRAPELNKAWQRRQRFQKQQNSSN